MISHYKTKIDCSLKGYQTGLPELPKKSYFFIAPPFLPADFMAPFFLAGAAFFAAFIFMAMIELTVVREVGGSCEDRCAVATSWLLLQERRFDQERISCRR